jgi:hypothetical protein
MTLVSAFRSFDQPVLLGDFLITRQGESFSLRKKLRRLSDRLVVGWTGHLIAAQRILRELEPLASGPGMSRDALSLFLTDFETPEGTGIALTGWIADQDVPEAFKWGSSYRQEVFWGEPWHLGSGGQTIEAMAGEGLRSPGESRPSPLGALVSVITRLLADEVRAQANRTLGFGHAYEALYWAGDRFLYLDNILYLTLLAAFDDQGKLESLELKDPAYKYSARGELAVITISRASKNEIDFHVITPVGANEPQKAEQLADELMRDDYVLSLASDFYSCLMDLRAPHYVGPLASLVLKGDEQPEPPVFFEREAGSLEIRLSGDIVTWMFRMIRKDQEESPS